MTDYTKLLSDFPEINPANYGDDEVNALNAWGIAAHTAIEALQAKLGDAIQSSAHWQHQFTEAQAENERLDKENTDSLVSLATAIQHRDGFRKQLDYHRHEMDDLEEDYSNLQAEIDALQSKLAAMGKGEPVAHVYAIERTGRPLVAWDDARGIGLGDKLYATPEALTEVINKARIFGLGLPIVQTERLIKAIESLKEPTP